MPANKYIKKLRPYSTTSHKAWEISDAKNILKIDWNEATIPPSPNVLWEIEKLIKNGRLNWYPDTGNDKLRKLIASYSKVRPQNVQYFAGSDDLHQYVIGAFTEPGNRALVISPTYDNFRISAESRGVSVHFHKLGTRFEFSLESFNAQMKKLKPQIAYICNPNNPTGTVYEPKEIEKIVHSFPRSLFIIDEAYYEFAKKSSVKTAVKHKNAIVSRTFSKAFALAGFRIGYAISSVENIGYLNKIRNPKNVTTLSQTAATAALQNLPYTEAYVKEVLETKRGIYRILKESTHFEVFCGGNFILLKVKYGKKKQVIQSLLKENIFVRDYGHVKGMKNYIRLTIGTEKQMRGLVKKLAGLKNV